MKEFLLIRKGIVNIMEQNLNLYHIFYTTAKAGNISLASKKLFISQPAVSKSIAKLEENLNTILFYRNSRGVRLTKEGMLLQEQLEQAFQAISYGEEQLRKIHDLGIGQLTIGVSTTLCKYVLIPYLQKFIQNNPHIKVSIACQPTSETIKGLRNGTLDIGLIGTSSDMKDLSFSPVMEIQDSFVTTKQYLKNLATRLECSDINVPLWNEATFLMLDEENISRRYINNYLQQENIEISQIIEISTMDLLIEFAKIDIGIACVIENFVTKELADGSLIRLPMEKKIPSRNIGFAWKDQTLQTTRFLSEISIQGSLAN